MKQTREKETVEGYEKYCGILDDSLKFTKTTDEREQTIVMKIIIKEKKKKGHID